MRNPSKIITFILLTYVLVGCHPMPLDVQQSAHDALENMRGDFEKACEYMYWYEKHDAHNDIEQQKNNLALIS